MKKVSDFLRFFIRANIIILCSLVVVFTLIGFLYYYYHLKLDPMHYVWWWWSHVKSFRIVHYVYFFIGFEILMVLMSLYFVKTEIDDETGHPSSKVK